MRVRTFKGLPLTRYLIFKIIKYKSVQQNYALLSPQPKRNLKYLRRLHPELRNGLLELPTAIQLMLRQRHRGYLSENSIDELNLQNPQKINQN